jgi:hypothetical protein
MVLGKDITKEKEQKSKSLIKRRKLLSEHHVQILSDRL